jgi:NAD(P)-dependent dehydrogenase (short-subunit alcohol dehydrogenase family)
MSKELAGKVAVVTGAGRNIGRAIALTLADGGASVLVNVRSNGAEAESVARQIEAAGGKAAVHIGDVADAKAMQAMADAAVKQFGRIDILVNNAGATWGAPTEDHPIEAWDKVMNLNIRALFILSQRIGKRSMIPNRYGRIINLASIAGLRGSTSEVQTIAYNTSKGAVVNFTRSLAGGWGRFGITVNALAPGMFPSKMTKGTIAEVGMDKLVAGVPLMRIGDDDDLKGAAILFASEAGKHITGQILAVDGGLTAVL